jgi:hypothetical protein
LPLAHPTKKHPGDASVLGTVSLVTISQLSDSVKKITFFYQTI